MGRICRAALYGLKVREEEKHTKSQSQAQSCVMSLKLTPTEELKLLDPNYTEWTLNPVHKKQLVKVTQQRRLAVVLEASDHPPKRFYLLPAPKGMGWPGFGKPNLLFPVP
jgi:hypothetical protein